MVKTVEPDTGIPGRTLMKFLAILPGELAVTRIFQSRFPLDPCPEFRKFMAYPG